MTSAAAAIRATGAFAIRRSGLAWLVRATIARRRVGILAYHDPCPETVERHLSYLERRYAFVDLDLLVDCLRAGAWERIPDRAIVVTLDDGYAGNARLAPVFARHGVHPTIFLCSQIVATNRHFWWSHADGDRERLKRVLDVERRALLAAHADFDQLAEYAEPQALSDAQIAALRETCDLQSHTRFHPILTMLADDECRHELELSRREVEVLTGRPCVHFAYPNGDHGGREVALARAAGYRSARTTRAGWNGPHTDPYRLRILGVADDASVDRLAASLTGVLFLKQLVLPAWLRLVQAPRLALPTGAGCR